MTRVTGHALVDAGSPYGQRGCPRVTCLVYGAVRLVQDLDPPPVGGHALCECGQRSPHLFSNRERRAWHRKHKDEVM